MGASDVRTSLNVHRNVHLRSYKALTLPYLHDILPFRHTSTPLCGESPQILTSCRRSSRWWRPGQRWAWPPHNWWQSAAPTQAECEWDRWRTCSGVRCTRTCSCEGREGNMWVHSDGEHEPTCACRHEAGTVSLEARMCVCVCVWQRNNASYMQEGLSLSWGNMHVPPFSHQFACSLPQGLCERRTRGSSMLPAERTRERGAAVITFQHGSMEVRLCHRLINWPIDRWSDSEVIISKQIILRGCKNDVYMIKQPIIPCVIDKLIIDFWVAHLDPHRFLWRLRSIFKPLCKSV